MTATMTAGLLAVTAQPAAAVVVRYEENSSWAYTDAHRPSEIYVDQDGDLPVGSWLDDRGRKHTSRAYFTFDITRYRGATISSAVFSARETAVTDCAARPAVELWRTAPVTQQSNWKKPPAELAKLHTRPGQQEGPCPASYLEWNAVEGLRQAVAKGQPTMTLALRLPAELEGDPAQGRRYASELGISISYNIPPAVPTDLVTGYDQGCAASAPGEPLPAGDVSMSAVFADRDTAEPGHGDRLTGEFAVWPVDDPAARTMRTGYASGPQNWAAANYPADLFEHGHTYAWAVRASDSQEFSGWSQACYFTKDNERPTQAPTVSSTDYPDDGTWHSGTGIPGEFTFGPNGSTDIAGYYYRELNGSISTYVAAGPDGTTTVTLTPRDDGPNRLYVRSADAAGNRSDETTHRFNVSDNGPIVEGTIDQIGVPSTLTFRPRLDNVVRYRYQFNGESEQTAAAGPDGVAQVTVTLRSGGWRQLTVTSRTAQGLEATTEKHIYLPSEPVVTSAQYPEQETSGGPGVPGVFTFTPRMPDVVSYRYSFRNGPEQAIEADAAGRANLSWTPTEAGWTALEVVSISADGSRSDPKNYYFTVFDPLPSVWGSPYDNTYPNGGPGVTGSFYLSTQVADVTEFVYQFNDGPEQVVAAQFGTAVVDFTPTIGGRQVLKVRSRTGAGAESPVFSYPFLVYSAPLVNSAEYPENAASGRPGVTGTFTFTPQLPGVVAYRFDFGDEERTVQAAAADGTASITWNPPHAGSFYLRVYGVTADGTQSDTRTYSFSVRDPNPRIESYLYNPWSPAGGVGVPGNFQFVSELSDTVDFRYQLNGGPEQTATLVYPGVANLAIAPDRAGEHVLSVRSRSATGELSQPVEFTFLVDNAPSVSSAVYPENSYGGGVGVSSAFTFTPGLPGTVEYVYHVDWGEEVTVAAGPDGTASFTLTPTEARWYSISVVGRTADGTESNRRYYSLAVLG
jgi:hypothetical protein